MTKHKPIILILIIIVVFGCMFLNAWLIKVAYNNSITVMTKSMDGKQQVPDLDYWTAFWLQLLISFIPLTIHTYSKVY